MTEYVTGLKIQSLVSPAEDGIGCSGTSCNNVGWTGNVVTALASEGGSSISRSFDGTSTEDDYAAFQGVLDGSLVAGQLYNVWIKARETGSGLSWANSPPSLELIDSDGIAAKLAQEPHYDVFWGGSTGETLTGTFKWFYTNFRLQENGSNGGFTANSIGMWIFPLIDSGNGLFSATKTLEIDSLRVEPILE